jgi:hypothetical protein
MLKNLLDDRKALSVWGYQPISLTHSLRSAKNAENR